MYKYKRSVLGKGIYLLMILFAINYSFLLVSLVDGELKLTQILLGITIILSCLKLILTIIAMIKNFKLGLLLVVDLIIGILMTLILLNSEYVSILSTLIILVIPLVIQRQELKLRDLLLNYNPFDSDQYKKLIVLPLYTFYKSDVSIDDISEKVDQNMIDNFKFKVKWTKEQLIDYYDNKYFYKVSTNDDKMLILPDNKPLNHYYKSFNYIKIEVIEESEDGILLDVEVSLKDTFQVKIIRATKKEIMKLTSKIFIVSFIFLFVCLNLYSQNLFISLIYTIVLQFIFILGYLIILGIIRKNFATDNVAHQIFRETLKGNTFRG